MHEENPGSAEGEEGQGYETAGTETQNSEITGSIAAVCAGAVAVVDGESGNALATAKKGHPLDPEYIQPGRFLFSRNTIGDGYSLYKVLSLSENGTKVTIVRVDDVPLRQKILQRMRGEVAEEASSVLDSSPVQSTVPLSKEKQAELLRNLKKGDAVWVLFDGTRTPIELTARSASMLFSEDRSIRATVKGDDLVVERYARTWQKVDATMVSVASPKEQEPERTVQTQSFKTDAEVPDGWEIDVAEEL